MISGTACRGFGHVDRDPHHLRSRFGQLDALLRRRRRIRRVGHRHRLHDDGRAAADLDGADADADGLVQLQDGHGVHSIIPSGLCAIRPSRAFIDGPDGRYTV